MNRALLALWMIATACSPDEGASCVSIDGPTDADGDGHSSDTDCNDNDTSIWPGAPELCDGVDSNCDGLADEDTDQDQDGYLLCTDPLDCDDTSASIFPGAPEDRTNRLDDNCNGYVDEILVSDQNGMIDMLGACGGGPIERDRVVFEPGSYDVTIGHDCNLRDDAEYFGIGGSSAVTIDLMGGGSFGYVPAGGEVLFEGITFINGSGYTGGASPGGVVRGGALLVAGGTLTLRDVVFEDCSAEVGGAVAALTRCETVPNEDDECFAPTLIAEGVGFRFNSADTSGGAIDLLSGTARITGAQFEANEVHKGVGGAIHAYDVSALNIRGALFQHNETIGAGGALRLEGSDVIATIANCSFVGNEAVDGGAVRWDLDPDSSLSLASNLFHANIADACPDFVGTPEYVATVDYSLFDLDTACALGSLGAANVNEPPAFIDFTDDGELNDDLHLAPGSPGIDAGGGEDGLDVDGSTNDIGAYGGPYGGSWP
jgi:hypothetical protein